MASNKAEIKWTSDDAAVLRAFEKMERNMDTLARKMDNVEKASKKSSDAAVNGFEAAEIKVKDFIKGFAGVGTVMAAALASAQMLKAEWEAFKNRQQSAADANVSLAAPMAELSRASGGLYSAKELEREVARIASDAGSKQARVASLWEQAVSAKGPTTKAEMESLGDLVKAALQFAPTTDDQTLALMVGGAADLQRSQGFTAEQAIGFFEMAGNVGRVSKIQQQATNMAPAINSLTQFGMSRAEAAALFGTLTRETGDFTGASSRTAALMLAKQIEDRGMGSTMEAITAMQNDPSLRDRFLQGGAFGGKDFAKASFEAAYFPTIRALLTGGTPQAAAFATSIGEVGDATDAEAAFRESVDRTNQLGSVQAARLQNIYNAGVDSIFIGDLRGAKSAISRKGLADMLAASGVDQLDQNITTTLIDALGKGYVSQERVSSELRRRAAEMSYEGPATREIFGGTGIITENYTRVATDQEKIIADVFRNVAEKLDRMVENTDPVKNGARTPKVRVPPAANLNGGGIR